MNMIKSKILGYIFRVQIVCPLEEMENTNHCHDVATGRLLSGCFQVVSYIAPTITPGIAVTIPCSVNIRKS